MNISRLIQVLSEHGFSPDTVEGGTELVISCPLCFDERARLYISTDRGLWYCFHCKARGHLLHLLMKVCGLTPGEAYLAERAIWGGSPRGALPGAVHRPVPSQVELPLGFQTDGGVGIVRDYFRFRGLNPRWIKEVGIGYCLTGAYHHRVIVPVYTQGELRTFVARTWLRDENKKVLMAEGSQAARALFGYDRPDDTGAVILVEGVFDAIRMWELGYPHTVATLGAHVTDQQRVLLKRLEPTHVILLRDADETGRESAIKEARELTMGAMLEVHIASLAEGDPGTARPSDIQRALDTARPVTLDLGIEVLKEVHHD